MDFVGEVVIFKLFFFEIMKLGFREILIVYYCFVKLLFDGGVRVCMDI